MNKKLALLLLSSVPVLANENGRENTTADQSVESGAVDIEGLNELHEWYGEHCLGDEKNVPCEWTRNQICQGISHRMDEIRADKSSPSTRGAELWTLGSLAAQLECDREGDSLSVARDLKRIKGDLEELGNSSRCCPKEDLNRVVRRTTTLDEVARIKRTPQICQQICGQLSNYLKALAAVQKLEKEHPKIVLNSELQEAYLRFLSGLYQCDQVKK